MPESPQVRPRGVVFVAAFGYFGTGISLLTAAALLAPGARFDWLWRLNESAHAGFAILGKTASILLVAVGLATFLTARGLLAGRRWAWWLAVGTFAVNVAGDVARFFMGDRLKGVAGLLIGGTFLLYLVRRPVRRYFTVQARHPVR